MDKKYILTDETLEFDGHLLHRIQAVTNFGNVKAGDLGGWIEKEENLSHEGNCWVSGEAKVSGDAKVYDNAQVYDNAWVHCYARVYGHAKVHDYAWVCGHAEVKDYAEVFDYATVMDYAKVYGFAKVHDYAKVYDCAEVYDYAKVCSHAQITGDVTIRKMDDYMVFQNNWSSGRFFTWTRSNDMWAVGCFYGSGKELIKKAYEDSEEKGDYYKLYVELVEKDKEFRRKYDRIDTLAL